MNNLQRLYEDDLAFRDIVDEAAAAAIGTTSAEFAAEWLKLAADSNGKLDGENAVSGNCGGPNDDYAQQRIGKLVEQRDAAERRVEQMRAQLGSAADHAAAILRVCMDCTEYAVVDMDGEVVA